MIKSTRQVGQHVFYLSFLLTSASHTKPRVSLTVPNHNQFAQVSLTILDFLDATAKAKKLIRKSIAYNLEQDLLTKRLFSFRNGSYFITI